MACPPKPPAQAEDSCRLLKPKRAAETSCPDAEFRVGNYQITYSLGCLRKTRVESALPNGWYNRVRIEDGQIVEVDNEETSTTLLPDLCLDPLSTGDLTAPDMSCNLSRISSGQLMTRLLLATPMPDDPLWLDGCGTDAMPVKANINPAKMREALGLREGMSLDACGVGIEHGVITRFPSQIVTGVINNAPGLLSVSINDQCQLVIGVPGYDAGTGALDAVYQAVRPCNSGPATITFGVFAGDDGRFYLRVLAGGPSYQPRSPAYFDTLASAQAFINTTVGICVDPSGAPGGA